MSHPKACLLAFISHLLANTAKQQLLTLLEAGILRCQVVQLCSSLLNPLLQFPD
jgi:hypothetical protein